MGWFDAPAGQANLLAGMSNIASHKIAEPNIGSAITSGLGKAVDAIKTRNDTLIKEEANTKVREILSQPMDAKNPMAQAQALAPWLARADAEHQMIGKDAVSNLFKDADFGIKKDTLSESTRHNKSDELLGTSKLEQQKIADANSLEQQKIADANALKLGLANVGVAQTNASTMKSLRDMQAEKHNIDMQFEKKSKASQGYEWDDKSKTFSKFNYELPEYKFTQALNERKGFNALADKIDIPTYVKDASKLEGMSSFLGIGNTWDSTHANYAAPAKILLKSEDLSLLPAQRYVAQLFQAHDTDGLQKFFHSKNTDPAVKALLSAPVKSESSKFTKEGNTLKSSSGKIYNTPTQEWLDNNTDID